MCVAIDCTRIYAKALQLDDDCLAEVAGAEQQHALGAGAQEGAKNRHHPSSETCFNDTADRAPCAYTDCIRRTGNAMIRRTKIVATLGPATDEPTVLLPVLAAGVGVVRRNFSHGHADDRQSVV